MTRTVLLATALFILASPLSVRAQAGRVPADKPKTLQRTADAVVVSGDPMKALWGKKLDKIRLFALQGGAFAPVPYQVDKRGTEGDYLIPQASMTEEVMEETGFDQRTDAERRQERIKHFEKKRKDYEENVAKGKMKQADLDEMRRVAYFDERTDELDYNDELVFMARDLGDRVHRSLWPTKEGVELEVEDPLNGEKAWAYLLYFPTSAPPPSTKDYVKYDPKGDTVEGQYAKLDFIDNKPLILEQIVGKLPDGGTLPNILDRFKLRIKIKPRLLFCAPLRFDENNTKSFTIGYKDGPVRVIRRNIFWITFGGLKVPFFPKAVIYYVFYDNALIGPTEIYNPFNPRIMLCGGSLFTAGVDLRKSIYGIELYTQDNPTGIVVDGKMNETEKNIVRAKQNWIVGYKEKDQVGIVVRVLFDEELQKKGAELAFTLLDDATARQEPEDEPGVHFFGYDVDLLKFPKGKYNVIFYQYIAFNFKKGDEQQFLHVLDHPLRIRPGGP